MGNGMSDDFSRIPYDEASQRLSYCDSYSRLPGLLDKLGIL